MGGRGSGGARRNAGRKKKQQPLTPTEEEERRQRTQEAKDRINARERERNEELRARMDQLHKDDMKKIRDTLSQLAEQVSGARGSCTSNCHVEDEEGIPEDTEDMDYDYDQDADMGEPENNGHVEDSDVESEEDDGPHENGQGRQKIKPKLGTPLSKHLQYMHGRFLGDLNKNIKHGQTWFMPEISASSMFTNNPTHDPQVFGCESRCCIYVHLPHVQVPKIYGTAVLKSMKCIFCEKSGHLESHGYDFRAAHTFGPQLNAWIFHRRVRCGKKSGGCGRTVAEIDPRFLAQVDTRITETFPFLTTVRGPAVHELLLNAYLELVTSSVALGTFVNMYNSLKKLEYWKTTSSYYNHAASWVESRMETTNSRTPWAFPVFDSNGHYNGLPFKSLQ